MASILSYFWFGFCSLTLMTCVFKTPAKNNSMDDEFVTTVTINNRFPTVSIPISNLGNLKDVPFLELKVSNVYNPTRVSMHIGARVGLGDTMTLIGSFSLFPADNGGNFLIDIAPYTDILCSGKTRDISIGLVQLPDGKDSFSLQINIRRAR